MKPELRAWGVTSLFFGVGLWALLFHASVNMYLLPHAIFYATLTINTYFSVRFYSSFTPPGIFQTSIDLALIAAYFALAYTLSNPFLFPLCALIIFTIAPAKYTQMLGATSHDKTLRKKILIDLLGTGLCAFVVALILTVMGSALYGAWILAILFFGANVYLLGIKPMYQFVP